ncbi:MAG: hypothetical protein R6V04_16775 [bacterium]
MEKYIQEIQKELEKYSLKLSAKQISNYIGYINDAQQFFPVTAQRAMAIKLFDDWKKSKDKKILTVTSEECKGSGSECVTTFGILGVDWPGFYDTCSGIIHEMGWNIYFTKGFLMKWNKMKLGIILIGILTETEDDHKEIANQRKIIISKIHRAAIGTQAKTYLLSEEIKKLEIYSHVIEHIEKIYQDDDLINIIGLNGEAVKYFAARSRDYIENRKVTDIADQILTNYKFYKKVRKTGNTIHLKISNFKTEKEGIFTGVTVAGPAQMLYLEDCLKTIELTNPNFQLKHNREFTTDDGVSIYRIEFVNSSGQPLSEQEKKKLEKSFDKMVLNKRRDRAQWIESIGGFEQYARAIIPLLIKETQATNKPQVYHAVCNTTELFIDFKVIIVFKSSKDSKKKIVNTTLDRLSSLKFFSILSVKPPKIYGETSVFIIDLRVTTTDFDNIENIYKIIKEKITSAIGDYRDFDQGMRTIDVTKLKTIRKKMGNIDKTLIRELYYSIEDFFRVSANEIELISHINIAYKMLTKQHEVQDEIIVFSDVTNIPSKNGNLIPVATLICLSYPLEYDLFPEVLNILEPYEVTISHLEKNGRDILICRLTENDKALSSIKEKTIVKQLKKMKK